MKYQPLARRHAAISYRNRHEPNLEFNDFFHYALVGLIEAVDRYEYGKGATFATFASYRIKGSILNGIEKLTEQQQQMRARQRILAERSATLKDAPSKPRSADDLFAELANIAIGLAIGCILEGTGLYRAEINEEGEEGEEAVHESAYTRYELKQLSEQMCALVDTLPERERLIIKLHYFHGATLENIGNELGLSTGRISQLHRGALAALRKKYERTNGIDKLF